MSENSQMFNEDDIAAAALRLSKGCMIPKQILNFFFCIMNDGNLFLIQILNFYCLEVIEKISENFQFEEKLNCKYLKTDIALISNYLLSNYWLCPFSFLLNFTVNTTFPL